MKNRVITSVLGRLILIIAFLVPSFISQTVSAGPQDKAPAAQKLHRADFRVSGASCVACLRRIGKTMREQKGVLKGDVSIFKPYWAIVIYDAGSTNMDKIFESVKHEKVKFEELEDKAIDSLPLIVIPKGMNSASGASAPPQGAH